MTALRSIPGHRAVLVALAAALPLLIAGPVAAQTSIRFATFGDYYGATANTARVAALVSGWNPDLILTNGDNSNVGSTAGYDTQVAQYYHGFIYYPPGHPSAYAGQGAASNNFFPALGNHDWDAGVANFQAYFTLPGNERYYDFVRGPVHFFVVDSDAREPDGNTSASAQAQWLQAALAAATEPWKVVCCHLPPYSSAAVHGSTPALQWPFASWGASLVLSGHDHVYERLERDGLTYVLAGTGGQSLYGFRSPPETGSVVRYSSDYGALQVDATATDMTGRFYSAAGALIDSFTLTHEPSGASYSESFDAFTVDQRVGTNPDWFDDGNGPYVRAANGIAGSRGLEAASNIFIWKAHPFSWSDPAFQKATFAMDFQASTGGSSPLFDDDRVGWMTTASDVNSDYIFGVQLDPVTDPSTGLDIEAYWRNSANDRIAVDMADLSGLTASAWYRLTLVVTKLGPASARLDATLQALDASGNPVATVASGTIADTGALLPTTDRPDARYFTAASLYPAYKNYTGISGAADNAYAEITTSGTPNPSGPIGSWPLDEGAGTVAHDASGNGNDGVVNGATWTNGHAAGALAFDGVNDRVTIPDSPSLTVTNAMTVACWMRATQLSAGWCTLMQRSNPGIAWFDWQLYARAQDAATANHPVFRVDVNGNNTVEANEEVQGDIVLQADTWYFIAATYDGQSLRFYIDGTLRGATATPGGPIPDHDQAIWIGGNDQWGEYYNGVIDEVSLFGRALSQPEILSLMTGQPLQHTVTVAIAGSGSVTRTPDQPAYDAGSVVQLQAVPAANWTFSQWSGDLTGSTNPANLTVTRDMHVTATFVPQGTHVVWSAFNDCVYDPGTNYRGSNVTTFGIGAGYTGPTSGALVRHTDGSATGVTVALTQSGGVNWQPSVDSGGHDANAGTDAFTTFGGIADMAGVVYYGSSPGWHVDLTVTGLDPAKLYTFATSACRAGTTADYDDRWTIFTISGVDAASNASTAGTQQYQGNPQAVWFNTGKNDSDGYVARWVNIAPGSDGSFTVRAEAHPSANSGYKAYAFSVFKLEQVEATAATYTLTTNVTGQGSVQREPDLERYEPNQQVQLTALPADGWTFSQWTGDLTGSTSPANLTVTRDMHVTAVFVPQGTHVVWSAFNDCVYDPGTNYVGANVTTFGIGAGYSGPTSGALVRQADGSGTGVTVALTQTGDVNWQPSVDTGGHDANEGTDAFGTFGGIADMAGVVYYGSSAGWHVDLAFSGLDPTKLYTFATSACRAGTTTDYDDRWTIFTISGVDAATNASTAGTQQYLGNPHAVWFNTGKNEVEGYVARWTSIAPGSDGSFTVRAEAHPSANSGYKAYAFSVFKLEQVEAAAGVYTLTTNVTGQGAVQRDPDLDLYEPNQQVQLTALPADGWTFIQWSGAYTGAENPCTVAMTGNLTVGAQFALTTDVNEGAAPRVFALRAASSNPAGRSLRLRYELPRDAVVSLRVYDLRGRQRAVLVDGFKSLGRHEVEWVTDAVASGIYYARFEAPGFRTVRKLTVLK